MKSLFLRIRFAISYYFTSFIDWLRPNPSKPFMIMILGGPPKNVSVAIKQFVDRSKPLRYAIGNNLILISLNSEKTLKEIEFILKNELDSYVENIIIFKHTMHSDKHYLINLHTRIINMMFKSRPVMSVNTILDELDVTLDVLNKSTEQFNNFFNDMVNSDNPEFIDFDIISDADFKYVDGLEPVDPPDEQEEDKMKALDFLLEKIQSNGFDSLTDQEKINLKKYSEK